MKTATQTILLADDSPANLELIVASLEEDGCELVVALDGREALELAERTRPDLILLDVMMPSIDGFEVCRQLKARPELADIPVIFMTALGMSRDKLEGFAAGAVDYLVKPLQLEEVRARVKVHLTLRALQGQLVAQNAELRANETRLRQSRALAARYDAQQEEERRELAHKIQEDLAQNLFALHLVLSTLNAGAREKERIASMRQTIDRSIRSIRDMVTMLRPAILDLGISATLRWLADDFQRGVGLNFELDIEDGIRIDDGVSTFLFRAARELLINVALHAAAAERVYFSFHCEADACHLVIRDDGRGFDPAATREEAPRNLVRLAEQAARLGGELVVEAVPGHGTTVAIHLPAPSCQRRLSDDRLLAVSEHVGRRPASVDVCGRVT